jgi:hypothetical protein
MHRLQRSHLIVAHVFPSHDDEVDVAVQVRVADREGTLQIRAAEVLREDRLRALDELAQNIVQLGKGSRVAHRPNLR